MEPGFCLMAMARLALWMTLTRSIRPLSDRRILRPACPREHDGSAAANRPKMELGSAQIGLALRYLRLPIGERQREQLGSPCHRRYTAQLWTDSGFHFLRDAWSTSRQNKVPMP